MAEYISREAAMLEIDAADFVIDDNFEGGATLLYCDDVVDRLSAIPAADVRPVIHAQWVRSEDADDGYCSNCKCDMPMCREDWEWKYCETDYCPNCGADMREVQYDD